MVANAMMASAGAGGDKTPDAVNWANIGPGNSPQTNANQTISGIDGSITLEVNYTGSGAALFYSIASGSFTPVANGGQFSVSNGQTVRFQFTSTVTGTSSGTVTVTNESDSSATLDTFIYSVRSQERPEQD